MVRVVRATVLVNSPGAVIVRPTRVCVSYKKECESLTQEKRSLPKEKRIWLQISVLGRKRLAGTHPASLPALLWPHR